MDPVKITKMGNHTMVSGSDKSAVERAVAELVRRKARLVSAVEALGRNWVATVEQSGPSSDQNDGCKVVRLGLQLLVAGPDRVRVQRRVQALLREGAVLKSGPEERDGTWVAVCDEGGVDKTVHRWGE